MQVSSDSRTMNLQNDPYSTNERYSAPQQSTHEPQHLPNPMQHIPQLILNFFIQSIHNPRSQGNKLLISSQIIQKKKIK